MYKLPEKTRWATVALLALVAVCVGAAAVLVVVALARARLVMGGRPNANRGAPRKT